MPMKLSIARLPSISLPPSFKPELFSKSVQTSQVIPDSPEPSQTQEYWRSNNPNLDVMFRQNDIDEQEYAQNRANARRTLDMIDEALKRL